MTAIAVPPATASTTTITTGTTIATTMLDESPSSILIVTDGIALTTRVSVNIAVYMGTDGSGVSYIAVDSIEENANSKIIDNQSYFAYKGSDYYVISTKKLEVTQICFCDAANNCESKHSLSRYQVFFQLPPLPKELSSSSTI